MIAVLRSGSTAAAAALLAGCLGSAPVDPNGPPADTAGRVKIAGFTVVGPKEGDFGYSGELSPEEKRLREQARAFDRTVWQGALIGAVAGGLIGAVAGGDAQEVAGGALVGAGVGALAGLYVANKQKEYARAEDQLEAMIADARAANRETEALIAQTRRVLEEDRRRLAAVQAQVLQGRATQRDLERERSRVWANRKVVEQAAQGARERWRVLDAAKSGFAQRNPGAPVGGFEQELRTYKASLDTLDTVAASMAKA